jgi:hypothetical protein
MSSITTQVEIDTGPLALGATNAAPHDGGQPQRTETKHPCPDAVTDVQ